MEERDQNSKSDDDDNDAMIIDDVSCTLPFGDVRKFSAGFLLLISRVLSLNS